MTLWTPIGVASISKQFTAAAVLALAERGRLSVEDRLSSLLPDVPQDKAGITVHQLLTHTAGVRGRYTEDFEAPSQQAAISDILTTPLAFEPGSRWRYSAAGYTLLAAIVEGLSGVPYANFLAQALLAPAGMRNTISLVNPGKGPVTDPAHAYMGWDDRGSPAQWPPNWRNHGAGDLATTAADLYEWERALRGGRVIPLQQLARMRSVQHPIGDDGGYGYGYFIHQGSTGETTIEHGGDAALGYNGSYFLYPDDDALIIILATARSATGDYLRHALGLPLEQLVKGGDVPAPTALSFLSQADLATLTGTYTGRDAGRMHVVNDGAHAWLVAEGQGAVNLLMAAAPEGAERANARTDSLLRALAAGSPREGYRAALTEEGASRIAEYVEDWAELVKARGPLWGYRLIGSEEDSQGTLLTRALLRFRSGMATITFFWPERAATRLFGTFVESTVFRPTAALPIARTPDGSLVARDPMRGHTVRVAFSRSDGQVAELRVGNGPEGIFRGDGLARWTPGFGFRDER
jgi:CubicO group peptidase (beta-lactamase class C family)